ncbi:MAG: L,D-transpeptidase family protein [Phycisphaerae bacterium]|nr:L,D-transpeptidase family protein [Phycisphaerae bacterium]
MGALCAASARTNDPGTALRRQLAWQVALEAVGFSPGIIDGAIGRKTQLATREFQRMRGLKQTGQLDSQTAQALQIDPNNVLQSPRIEARHLKDIGPDPASWLARSKLSRLGHRDLEEVLAEQYHCTRGLLRRLNPGVTITDLKVGDTFIAPQVIPPARPRPAPVIEINLSEQIIRVIDRDNKLVGLFHCSIAAHRAKRPTGQARITRIVPNPEYTFRPEMWPEVTEKIDQALRIPPGPRNPVGRCWIALSLPGYGIHGTPNPELIGKTGSHGCFRMTNWDALRLSTMVRIDTEVRFVE